VDRVGATGFTHYFAEQNDGWLASDEGLEFFDVAARLGLVASLSVEPTWFDDLARIARAYPTMPILLHHLGFARSADSPESAGLAALVKLADLPNIAVKVSGFYYGSGKTDDYPYVAQTALFERIYDAFGAHRLTWGSDFPVSAWDACTYPQTLDVVRRHCAFLSAADLGWIMGETIARILATGRPLTSTT
jgi:predicted TIM-barrel fold metal-dependent hydrolase